MTIDRILDGTGADRSSEFQILTDNTGTPPIATRYKIQTNAFICVLILNASVNEKLYF